MKMLIVNSDHDKTLNKEFTTSIAIKYNRSLDPRKALDRLMAETITINKGTLQEKATPLLPRDVVCDYCQKMGKTELDTLLDIARCGEWGMYEDGRVPKEALIQVKAGLLVGLTKEDLKKAVNAAGKTLTKGAIKYANRIAGDRFVHIIVSDGWKPIVEGTANALRDHGAQICVVAGHTPIFENGKFTGKLDKIDKWNLAFSIYEALGFSMNEKGIYELAVCLDDSAANIDAMKKHGLPIAFNPTGKDARKFDEASIQVESKLDLASRKIWRYAKKGDL